MDTFILKDRKIRKVDTLEWAKWFKNIDNIRVAQTIFSGILVSTVFLGMEPIYFETMVFGGRLDDYQWRYDTYGEAVKGHQHAVKCARFLLRIKKRG